LAGTLLPSAIQHYRSRGEQSQQGCGHRLNSLRLIDGGSRCHERKGALRHRRYAEHISEQAQENIAAAAQHNEVLAFVSTNPASSQASIAAALGWKLYNGEPNKMKASRCLRELIKAKLIGLTRAGRYKLTSEGEAVLKGEADENKKRHPANTPKCRGTPLPRGFNPWGGGFP
jgi:hypothetical protein